MLPIRIKFTFLTSTMTDYYAISKQIKKDSETITSKLLSILHDSNFVDSIFAKFPPLTPKFANLRCGLWYHPNFTDTCYFKSTDGHAFKWDFSPKRLNLNVLTSIIKNGICVIVDSTKRGKVFPDSLSKTIPIWTATWNSLFFENCDISLPDEIGVEESALIRKKLSTFTSALKNSGIDPLNSYKLSKPIKCIWIEPNTDVSVSYWTKESINNLDYYPLILVSASDSKRDPKTFGWRYFQGAGDDHQDWSNGLTPDLFYKWEKEILADESFIENIVDSTQHKDAHKLIKSNCAFIAIGTTGLFIGSFESVPKEDMFKIYCGYCDHAENDEMAKWFNVQDNKKSKSLEQNLTEILSLSNKILSENKQIVYLCPSGVSESIAVCIAVLAALFDKNKFIGIQNVKPSKESLRQIGAYISTFVHSANPSRNLMKQLNRYFIQ
jgi:tRNA A64-2'-O-ribosylphosphate transferase